MQFSIILPVYNVEKYLRECLDSILNQTLQDFEIICINDESIDNSLEILNEYSSKDNRVKVYSKKNEGQGIARNFGLKLAKGDFISFIDPDDWIEPTMLEDAYNAAIANNAIVVRFLHRAYFQETKIFNKPHYKNAIKPNAYNSYQDIGQDCLYYSNSPCNKIYKREFLISNNILFSDARIAEDQPFSIKLKLLSPFYYLDKVLYNYRIHNESTTFSKKHNPRKEIEICKDIIKDLHLEKELAEPFDYYIVNRLFKYWNDSKFLFFKTYLEIRGILPSSAIPKINKTIFKYLFSVGNEYDDTTKYKYFYLLGGKVLLFKQKYSSTLN